MIYIQILLFEVVYFMSKRKTKEIIKNMDIIEGNNQNLQWLIVSAFRYSVNRHFTQAMWGIEDVIVNNLHVLDKVFIKQFIDDEREWNYEASGVYYTLRDLEIALSFTLYSYRYL